MEFTIALESPLNLDYTLESGQVFRWENRGLWWYGVVSGGVLKARQEGDVLMCSSSSDLIDSAFVRNYFRLEDDLQTVQASVMKDQTTREAFERFYGLRLVRQDRWECLASFVLATNTNIPRIRKMVSSICERYGSRIEFEGTAYYAFPSPEALSAATVAELRGCGLGYRAPFLKGVAESVASGTLDFDLISRSGYEEARSVLVSKLAGAKVLPGVGPKVADCTLLYAFGKDEAFPIDVWVARALVRWYPKLLDRTLRKELESNKKIKLGLKDYYGISAKVRDYFGPAAGYAQQYLFMASRAGD